MTIEELRENATAGRRPLNAGDLVRALWHDARGDWDRAHRITQEVATRNGSWVHAYLHRKEGDLGNARYWYSRAGRPECRTSLEQEWEEIALHLLSEERADESDSGR